MTETQEASTVVGADFTKTVAALRMTDERYQDVRIDGTAPVEIVGTHTLETAILSQGTAGSLALATRLALAELYPEEMDGFLVLDDSFTDMDPD